jgi:pimeloyl-ACP methyl ester carboxylesterase
MPNDKMRMLVPAGVEERWTEVSGVRVRYLIGGSGPPLLFVHGLVGFSFSWSENLEFFARHFTAIALDLPNMGYSQRAQVGCSLREQAEFIFAFMQQLGRARFLLVGSSHGGALGLTMAALHPEKIHRLVLVSPPHPESEKARWNVSLFASFIGPFAGWLVCNAPIPFWGLAVGHLYGDRKHMPSGTAAGYGEAVRQRNRGASYPDYARLEKRYRVHSRITLSRALPNTAGLGRERQSCAIPVGGVAASSIAYIAIARDRRCGPPSI